MKGPDAFLKAVRAMRRPFTAHDLLQASDGVSARSVEAWIAAQAGKGEIRLVGAAVVPGEPGARKAYEVVRRTAAPRRGNARQQLWNAMRSLPSFTIRELAVAASTDVLEIGESTAGNYVRELAASGLLLCVGNHDRRGGLAKTWRLRPAANTGPLAPVVHRRLVIDRNAEARL